MAGEIIVPSTIPGLITYSLVLNSVGKIAQLTDHTLVIYATSDRGNYDVQLVQQGSASGIYIGDFPLWLPAGVYSIFTYSQSGANPAELPTDQLIDVEGAFYWSGGAVISLSDTLYADIKKVNGVTVKGTGTVTDPWNPV